MGHDVFSPWPFPGHQIAPGSAEVIYLRRALLVLKGTFFHPLRQQEAPLPRHRWALVHSGERFIEGGDSDARGISTIFEDPATRGGSDNDAWELMLIPLYPGRADSDDYATHQEAWIDLEKNEWVHSEEVRAKGVLPYGKVHDRKLLRIPLWSTRRKVEMGGGFSQNNPHSPGFATSGELKTSELRPHGTPASPWVIAVDHGLLKTHLQFHYYDPVAKADRVAPPGMMVQALADDRSVIGGSTAQLDDGSTYVLLAREPSKAGDFNYALQTAEHAHFSHSARKVQEAEAVDMELLLTHYYLPQRWGSVGQEAWEGPADSTAGARKPFAELRTKGQDKAKPLCFHLDDVAIVNLDGTPVTLAGKRVCLMDHKLAIKQQASNSTGKVPYSTPELTRMPLRAEEMIVVRGEGMEAITRVIDYEGQIFEVDHQRTQGVPGQDPLVGTRAAHLGELRFGRNFEKYEVYVIDTRYLRTTYDGKSCQSAHLLVHVSCLLEAPKADDQSDGKNEARTKGLPKLEHLLWKSSLRWGQLHPAHPEGEGLGSANKEHVLVPRDDFASGKPILRIRYHFGARLSQQRIDLGSMNANRLKRITIQIHPQEGRATGGDPMHLYLKFGPLIEAPPVATHPEPPDPYDFMPRGTVTSDRLDLVAGNFFTLAHELGHSIALPDEYLERMEIDSAGLPELLYQWSQSNSAKPYHLDDTAMMKGNLHPRLRYQWMQAAALDRMRSGLDPEHFIAKLFPWVPRYAVKGANATELRYKTDLPPSFMTFSPWEICNHGKANHCKLWVFRAADDEGMRGPLFFDPPKLIDEGFDGLLVVHTDFWFDYHGITDPDDQWRAMYTRFGRAFFQRNTTPHFYIKAAAGAKELRKVALVFQPRFEFGPAPTRLSPASGSTPAKFQEPSKADVRVIVRNSPGRGITTSASGDPPEITINQDDIGMWLMRYAIDPAANAKTSGNEPLTAAELGPINTWLAGELKRAPGTVHAF